MQEKNTQYEMDTNNKEHNETDFFFVLRPFFFSFFCKLGLLIITFLWGRLRVNLFFFLHCGRAKLETETQTHKRNRTKQEARHNQT